MHPGRHKSFKDLGLGQGTADAVYNLDEHWNGMGYPPTASPARRHPPSSPASSTYSQTIEVFHSQYGPVAAIDCIKHRSGRWFDPLLVRAAISLARRNALWNGITSPNLKAHVRRPRTQLPLPGRRCSGH